MYRPNFCCDCGERVVRGRWRAWTSRRFCQACERRRGRAWLAPLIACAALAGSGFATGRLMRPAPPPLVVERRSLPVPALLVNSRAGGAGTADTGAASQGGTGTASGGAKLLRAGADGGPVEPPTDPAEVVSICGARTQKGRPCSRRVRGTGRCWQHRGLPAMLPPEKLLIRE